MISLSWPWALVALLAVPLLAGFWWWMRQRRRRTVVRLPSVALIRASLPARSLWKRRVAVALFGGGLLVLGLGAARPQAQVAVPQSSASILLAIDVSGSMCSTDVEPNRLVAAQEAAREFLQAQPGRVGLVAFAGFAGLLVEPTTDTEQLLEALENLRTARGTAIGMAILASIDAIAETNPAVAPTGVELPAQAQAQLQPDAIVILTDGANTTGVPPITAAAQAAARGLRVFTIGFGTDEGAQLVCDPSQINPDSPFGRGWPNMTIDDATLTEVAESTGGKYFRAEDAGELTDVLLDLPGAITLETEDMEVTVFFVLAGALLVIAAVGLSLWWNRPRSVPAGASAPKASVPE